MSNKCLHIPQFLTFCYGNGQVNWESRGHDWKKALARIIGSWGRNTKFFDFPSANGKVNKIYKFAFQKKIVPKWETMSSGLQQNWNYLYSIGYNTTQFSLTRCIVCSIKHDKAIAGDLSPVLSWKQAGLITVYDSSCYQWS